MPRVAVIHHNRALGVGRLAPFLARRRVVDVWAPQADFPGRVDAVVVMGGFMGAYQDDLHPWLTAEKRWLAERLAADTPILGICLGSQLLAEAAGGRAFPAARPEVGVVDVTLTRAGEGHPVAAHLGERAFLAHQDTFELPEGATLLAATAVYPAAFQVESGLGVQPHPETPAAEAIRWASQSGFDLLDRAGLTREEYARGLREHARQGESASRRFFAAWFRTWEDG